MLTRLMVIIPKYIQIWNHYFEHLKLTQCYVNDSLKLESGHISELSPSYWTLSKFKCKSGSKKNLDKFTDQEIWDYDGLHF